MTTVEIDHRLSSSLFLFFSKNKSVWFGIRCTLDTSSKGDRQRNVRTGEGVGTGKRGGGGRERRYRFPGGGWWGIDDRIASTPAEPITRLNLRSPLSLSLSIICLPVVLFSSLQTRHLVSTVVRRALDSIFPFSFKYGTRTKRTYTKQFGERE